MRFFNAIHTAQPAPITGLVPLRVIYGHEIRPDKYDIDRPIDYDKFALAVASAGDTTECIVDLEWHPRWPQFFRLESKNDLRSARNVVQDLTNIAASVRGDQISFYNLPMVPSGYSYWQLETGEKWERQRTAMLKLGFGDDCKAAVIDASPLHTDLLACEQSFDFDLESIREHHVMPIYAWLDVRQTPPALLDRLIVKCKASNVDAVLWLPWEDDDMDGTWRPRAFDPAWPWVAVVEKHIGENK